MKEMEILDLIMTLPRSAHSCRRSLLTPKELLQFKIQKLIQNPIYRKYENNEVSHEIVCAKLFHD